MNPAVSVNKSNPAALGKILHKVAKCPPDEPPITTILFRSIRNVRGQQNWT
ncbi:hypothetical protein L2E71_12995 [Planktothrix agardhii 1032]|jgi:hypothetical protein|nr:hypothetical protein [Planktothrix agardhii 1032]